MAACTLFRVPCAQIGSKAATRLDCVEIFFGQVRHEVRQIHQTVDSADRTRQVLGQSASAAAAEHEADQGFAALPGSDLFPVRLEVVQLLVDLGVRQSCVRDADGC